jgi:hypothetical protein
VSQSADKPNSVRLRSVAPHGAPQLRRDDHSSRSVIAHQLRRPTRWPRTGRPLSPPYLVLLRAGFCLPPTLPPARCALTAPFHPYFRMSGALGMEWWRRSTRARHHTSPSPPDTRKRYVFCATVRQVALPGRYPAHCPSEFGLSSHLRPFGLQWASSFEPARRSTEVRKRAIVWLTATIRLSRTRETDCELRTVNDKPRTRT